MAICQNCRKAVSYNSATVAYISNAYTTYICDSCAGNYSGEYSFEQPAAVRECNECGTHNEFEDWCFTCTTEKIFWNNRIWSK
jgi:RNase P subunit RPR2